MAPQHPGLVGDRPGPHQLKPWLHGLARTTHCHPAAASTGGTVPPARACTLQGRPEHSWLLPRKLHHAPVWQAGDADTKDASDAHLGEMYVDLGVATLEDDGTQSLV